MNLEALRASFAIAPAFDLTQILVHSVLLVVLSSILSIVYFFTSNSVSNRSRLASIFPITALSTMLIISIIRSSLALSLGLVGALSIVRFRSAIKDPEELVYIFLTIALGLGFGADQAALTSVFFFVIIAVIIIQAILRGRFGGFFSDRDSVHLEITFTNPQTLPEVLTVLDKHCVRVKLTRLDESKQQTMMFLIKPKSPAAIDAMRTQCLGLDPKAQLSFLQYQPLV